MLFLSPLILSPKKPVQEAFKMYWLNGIASQLSLDCTVSKDSKDIKDEKNNLSFSKSLDIISIKPSHHASLFITCTRSAIYLWSVKVSMPFFFYCHLVNNFLFVSQLLFLLLCNAPKTMSKSLVRISKLYGDLMHLLL